MRCFFILFLGLFFSGWISFGEISSDSFSVMTYNLNRYALADRDEDGVVDDPKPDRECNAVIAVILQSKPDILLVQEMGDEAMFSSFKKKLSEAGFSYSHSELVRCGRVEMNQAVLSRFPITSIQHHTNEWYRVGRKRLPVLRGFLDVEIQVNPDYRFRLLGAHLKSKYSGGSEQREMRRNEARLLRKIVLDALNKNPDINLIVAGDMNDSSESASLKEIKGSRNSPLNDLCPADSSGEIWTYGYKGARFQHRLDYILVSQGMRPEVVTGGTRVIHDPLTRTASDHRPVLAVFRSADF